jgi:5'-nucleotidase
MRVLVTNDDGIASAGIATLAKALASEHDVLVVAPDRDMSGSSASIARFAGRRDIVFQPGAIEGLDVPVYTIAAGPALAVLSACLGGFGARPDLVVSGINSGANLGHSILHSGTVGAVLTAQSFGVRGLAVSAALGEKWRWDTASAFATRMAAWMGEQPPRTVVNLNVPALDEREVRGLERATLARFGTIRIALDGGEPFDVRQADERAVGPAQGAPLQLELRDGAVEPEEGSDASLLAQGFATYTPLIAVGEAELGAEPPAGPIGAVEQRVVAAGEQSR